MKNGSSRISCQSFQVSRIWVSIPPAQRASFENEILTVVLLIVN
jgi:hypothetical protein